MKGKVVLETGETLEGDLVIDGGVKTGRVVFDTRVVGYEKVLTSPDYSGKIVCFTYPLIGNYGLNYEDIETDIVFPSGVIISEYSEIYSSFRAVCSLKEFLSGKGITVIEGIDTQCITKIVREHKGIKGLIAPATVDEAEIGKKIKEDIKSAVPVEKDVFVKESPYIAVVNKVKRSEIFLLESSGLKLSFLNSSSPDAKDVLSRAKGIYLASSFEDTSSIYSTAEVIKNFIGDIPVFGVGSGHLAVALALGGSISKDMVNHYGTNHPVRDTQQGRKYITTQSHSLVIDKRDVKGEVRFINIVDGSIEGLTDRKRKIFSVAFQPSKEIIQEFFSFL